MPTMKNVNYFENVLEMIKGRKFVGHLSYWIFALWIPSHKVKCSFYKEKTHSVLYFCLVYFFPIDKFSYCYTKKNIKPD